jgi:hypothetical protein
MSFPDVGRVGDAKVSPVPRALRVEIWPIARKKTANNHSQEPLYFGGQELILLNKFS